MSVDPTNVRQTRGFLFADLRDYSRFTERFGMTPRQLLASISGPGRDAIARFEGAGITARGRQLLRCLHVGGLRCRAGLAILDDAAH